ncbi:hypothetical protein BDW69DRAFT_183585 [Aspergillus filifer]
MPHPLTLVRATFPLLGFLSIYTMWIPYMQKGFYYHATEVRTTRNLTPEGDVKLLELSTGIQSLDRLIETLVISFWPVVKGQDPALSLLGLTFAASWGTLYILLALEARRTKSTLCVAWRLAWLMILLSFFSEAFVLPIYCAVTLSRSPHPTGARKHQPFRSLEDLPISLIICFYTPVALIALPVAGPISDMKRQLVMYLTVGWPLWAFLVVATLSFLSYLSQRPTIPERNELSPSNRRTLYMATFLTAAITHLVALLAPLVLEGATVSEIFCPPLPWAITWFSTKEEAIAAFLQWDHIISGATLVLWALGVYTRDCDEDVDLFRLALMALGLTIVASPAGAATVLIWKLDMTLHLRAGGKTGKTM